MNNIKKGPVVNKLLQIIFAVFILMICAIPAFYKAGIGAYHFDEPYQIMNGMSWRNVPVAPLSSYITGIIGEFVGWKWISFRYIAISINLFCILMGGFILYYRTRKYFLSLLITGSAVLIGTIFPNVHNLYGWDSWSKLMLVLTMYTLLLYLYRPSYWLISFIGLFSAITILMRVPNIILIPIIFILICSSQNFCNYAERLKACTIYLVVVISALFLIICLLFGSLSQYISSFAEHQVADHGFLSLIRSFIGGIYKLLPTISMLWATFKLFTFSNRVSKPLYCILACVVCIFLYYNLLLSKHGPYFGNELNYSTSFVILGLLTLIFYYRDNRRSYKFLATIAIFFIAAIPVVGSNTFWAKFITWPILPIVCLFLFPYLNRAHKTLYTVFVISILMYSYNGLRHSSFSDSGIIEANYRINVGHFKGIKTTTEKGKLIDALLRDYGPYNNEAYENIVLRQGVDYIYEYLFLCRNNYLHNRFDLKESSNNEDYVNWVEQQVTNSKKTVALLYMIPKTENGDYDYSPSMLQTMLENQLKPIVIRDQYVIYVRQ